MYLLFDDLHQMGSYWSKYYGKVYGKHNEDLQDINFDKIPLQQCYPLCYLLCNKVTRYSKYMPNLGMYLESF